MNFVDELFAGREVVAIAADISSDSSIFWADAGGVFSFSRSLGECGPRTDYDAIEEHFEKLQREGALVLVRGRRFLDR